MYNLTVSNGSDPDSNWEKISGSGSNYTCNVFFNHNTGTVVNHNTGTVVNHNIGTVVSLTNNSTLEFEPI